MPGTQSTDSPEPSVTPSTRAFRRQTEDRSLGGLSPSDSPSWGNTQGRSRRRCDNEDDQADSQRQEPRPRQELDNNPFALSDDDQALPEAGEDAPTEDESESNVDRVLRDMCVKQGSEQILKLVSQLTESEKSTVSIVALHAVVDGMKAVATALSALHDRDSYVRLGEDDELVRSEGTPKSFAFSTTFKADVRRSARSCMLEQDVTAYNSETCENGLFQMVVDKVKEQPRSYQRVHLPPNYSEGNSVAVAHVNGEVKLQLKHVRNKARNVVLTGVTGGSGAGRIPDIRVLTRLLWRHFKGSRAGCTDEEIDARVGPLLMVRFAYIRLVTMVNLFDVEARNISQWDQIDSQLKANRKFSVNYTNQWHKLICAKDAALFGHSPAFSSVDKSVVVCPTNAEVEARLLRAQERSGV